MKFSQQKILVLLTFLFFVSNLSAQKIAYSRDGSTLAVNWTIDVAGGDDYSQFLFYDVKAGKLKSSFNATDAASMMLFTSDSKTLVIGERLTLEKIGADASGKYSLLDNPVSIENLTIDQKFQDDINAELLGLALSPDGKTVYKLFPNFLNAYSFPELKFQPEKSRTIKLVEDAGARSNFLAVSPDGTLIVESAKSGKNSSLIFQENGKQTAQTAFFKLGEDEDEFPYTSGVVSRNNETLMLRSSFDSGINSQISFWDLKKHTALGNFSYPLLEVSGENDFFQLDASSLSPDGKKAAVSFKTFDEKSFPVNFIAVYDIASKKSVDIRAKPEDNLHFAQAIAFSSDSKQLATLSTVLLPGKIAAKIQLWDAVTGKLIRDFE